MGPNITDLAGNLMNQREDLKNGNAFQNRFQFEVRVSDTESTTLSDDGLWVWDITIFQGAINDGAS